jgi:hypothetical protein
MLFSINITGLLVNIILFKTTHGDQTKYIYQWLTAHLFFRYSYSSFSTTTSIINIMGNKSANKQATPTQLTDKGLLFGFVHCVISVTKLFYF